MHDNQPKEFTGVWIPRKVIEDKNLSMSEMMIYSEIACFDVCFKSNEKLGERHGLKSDTVSKIISKLIKKGYVYTNKATGEYRKLSVNHKPLSDKNPIDPTTPLGEKSYSLSDKNPTIDNIENTDGAKAPMQPSVAEEKKPFIFSEYLEEMKKSNNKSVKMISIFFIEKNLKFKTLAEVQLAIRRNLKEAGVICKTYKLEDILEGISWCKKEHPNIWTIETITKYLITHRVAK